VRHCAGRVQRRRAADAAAARRHGARSEAPTSAQRSVWLRVLRRGGRGAKSARTRAVHAGAPATTTTSARVAAGLLAWGLTACDWRGRLRQHGGLLLRQERAARRTDGEGACGQAGRAKLRHNSRRRRARRRELCRRLALTCPRARDPRSALINVSSRRSVSIPLVSHIHAIVPDCMTADEHLPQRAAARCPG
jgi:hypothetical protein